MSLEDIPKPVPPKAIMMDWFFNNDDTASIYTFQFHVGGKEYEFCITVEDTGEHDLTVIQDKKVLM